MSNLHSLYKTHFCGTLILMIKTFTGKSIMIQEMKRMLIHNYHQTINTPMTMTCLSLIQDFKAIMLTSGQTSWLTMTDNTVLASLDVIQSRPWHQLSVLQISIPPLQNGTEICKYLAQYCHVFLCDDTYDHSGFWLAYKMTLSTFPYEKGIRVFI